MSVYTYTYTRYLFSRYHGVLFLARVKCTNESLLMVVYHTYRYCTFDFLMFCLLRIQWILMRYRKSMLIQILLFYVKSLPWISYKRKASNSVAVRSGSKILITRIRIWILSRSYLDLILKLTHAIVYDFLQPKGRIWIGVINSYLDLANFCPNRCVCIFFQILNNRYGMLIGTGNFLSWSKMFQIFISSDDIL